MDINEQIRALRRDVKKPIQKEVDKVLAKKTVGARARAAIELWLKVNPLVDDPRFEAGQAPPIPAQLAHQLLLENIKWEKDNLKNKFAVNTTGSMRTAYRMLPEMLHFVQLFHPDLFDGTIDEQKDKSRKLTRAFPEYQIGVI